MDTLAREALRYAGMPGADESWLERACAALSLAREAMRPRAVWRAFPLAWSREGAVLAGAGLTLPGETARRMLTGCGQAALMLCTLGAPFDTLILREQKRDMGQALLLNGCGAALVEALCDQTEAEIAGRFPGACLTDRFSPGYGDLPLTVQPGLLSALDAPRRAGVTLLPSLMMTPAKTVTAILGLSGHPQPARVRGCDFCVLRERCAFRREGGSCHENP
nr:vitamin B12(or cobalamine)-dependent methionine synthase activation domain [uncultured bacterium]